MPMRRNSPVARSSQPPVLSGLTFDDDETDALILGLCLVARCDGDVSGDAAERALDRISAALPREPPEIDLPTGRKPVAPADPTHVSLVLQAIRNEECLTLSYVDRSGRPTLRTICPIAFAAIGAADTVAAWCELRRDFRHFRLDRIKQINLTGRTFWRRRRILFAAWRASEDDEGW